MSKSLAAGWLLNEGGGPSIYDLSGNAHTGTFVGSAQTWRPGSFGDSVLFTGASNPQISFPAVSLGTQNTICAWVKLTNTTNNQMVMSTSTSDYGTMMGLLPTDASNRNLYCSDGGSIENYVVYSNWDTNWHHYAFVRTDSNYSFYVDGVLVGTSNLGGTNVASSPDQIGRYHVSTSFNMNGNIDHLLLFNRPLTASEIRSLVIQPFSYMASPARVAWMANGPSVVTGVGTANGDSTASGVGASLFAGVGSAAGLATASAVGASLSAGVGTANGLATASAVGASLSAGVGSAAGLATASAVGASLFAGVGTAAGDSTASGVGASLFAGVGSANGLATANGVGSTARSGSVATANGDSTASAVGSSLFSSVGTANGNSTAAAVGSSLFSSVGTATGTSTASAVGASLFLSVGTANGTSTAAAISTTVFPSLGGVWLISPRSRDWLMSPQPTDWLADPREIDWLISPRKKNWLISPRRKKWLAST